MTDTVRIHITESVSLTNSWRGRLIDSGSRVVGLVAGSTKAEADEQARKLAAELKLEVER
jgi:hypothetical protein